jgi:hypothetical protein
MPKLNFDVFAPDFLDTFREETKTLKDRHVDEIMSIEEDVTPLFGDHPEAMETVKETLIIAPFYEVTILSFLLQDFKPGPMPEKCKIHQHHWCHAN